MSILSFIKRAFQTGVIERGIDAAGAGPRWSGVRPMPRPASAIHGGHAPAAARISGMVLNDPYAASILAAYVDGPAIRPVHDDAEAREQLIAIADRLYDEGDAEGLVNLGEFLRRAVSSLVVTGNVFIHLEVDAATGALRFRHLPTSQLDRSRHSAAWMAAASRTVSSLMRLAAAWPITS